MELCHYLYPPLDKKSTKKSFFGFFSFGDSTANNLSINQFPNEEKKIKFQVFLCVEVKKHGNHLNAIAD
jgi:hypothetical protein